MNKDIDYKEVVESIINDPIKFSIIDWEIKEDFRFSNSVRIDLLYKGKNTYSSRYTMTNFNLKEALNRVYYQLLITFFSNFLSRRMEIN